MGIWLDVSIPVTRPSVVITNARLKWSIVGVDDIPIDHLVENLAQHLSSISKAG